MIVILLIWGGINWWFFRIVNLFYSMAKDKISTMQNIVNFFVKKSNGDITQLKLQKLLYYVYALNYSDKQDENAHFNNSPLEFQAWVYGPVNPELRDLLINYNRTPVTLEDASIFDRVEEDFFESEELGILESIWILFGHYTPSDLVRISHSEEPWQEKRVDENGDELPEDENSQNVISTKTMKEYYRSKYEFIWAV